MELLCSFLRHHFMGKLLVVPQKVICFLGLHFQYCYGRGGDPLFGLSEDISLNRMWSLCEVYLLTKDSARLQVTRRLRLGVTFI